jgi:hypothetical protein
MSPYELYTYDIDGNLISEEYADSTNDVYYSYYANGNMHQMRNNGKSVTWDYDSEDRLVLERTYLPGGIILPKSFVYDSEDRVIEIRTLGETKKYTYDSDGRISKEEFYNLDLGVFYYSWIEYTYDSNGNIIKRVDNSGQEELTYYEPVSYDCQEAVCSDAACDNYTFVDSTCEYDRVKKKVVDSYAVDVNYNPTTNEFASSCSSENPSDCYSPIEVYDSEGRLIEDDYSYYTYDTEGKLIKQTVKENPAISADFSYASDDELTSANFNYGTTDETETYDEDPLGRIVSVDYVSDSFSGTVVTPTGSVIKSFFMNFFSLITGHAVSGSSDDDNSVTLYLASPGDTSTAVPAKTLDEFKVSYELEYGSLNERDYTGCNDYDSNFAFKDSTAVASYVMDRGIVYSDTCDSEGNIKEYYCGLGITGRKVSSKVVQCANGCSAGACLNVSVQPKVNVTQNPSCFDAIKNQDETGTDCGGVCPDCSVAPCIPYIEPVCAECDGNILNKVNSGIAVSSIEECANWCLSQVSSGVQGSCCSYNADYDGPTRNAGQRVSGVSCWISDGGIFNGYGNTCGGLVGRPFASLISEINFTCKPGPLLPPEPSAPSQI